MMQTRQTLEDMGFERLMTMKDVRDLLGVSYGVIYSLIEDGRIRAVKVTGEPVAKDRVDETVQGLRFYPSDVRRFLKNQTIS